MVIYLERGADLHMAQRIPLPLTVSCSSKIQIGFTFLVPAHPGSPGQRAVKRVCVCVCVLRCTSLSDACLNGRVRSSLYYTVCGERVVLLSLPYSRERQYRYALLRWQFDSRRIYVRPRTSPQSAHLWCRSAAGRQRAESLGSCATQPACYSLGWDRQTDGSRYRLIPPYAGV